eukprot:365192-Chlamydomonas_euryale.AAC.8
MPPAVAATCRARTHARTCVRSGFLAQQDAAPSSRRSGRLLGDRRARAACRIVEWGERERGRVEAVQRVPRCCLHGTSRTPRAGNARPPQPSRSCAVGLPFPPGLASFFR